MSLNFISCRNKFMDICVFDTHSCVSDEYAIFGSPYVCVCACGVDAMGTFFVKMKTDNIEKERDYFCVRICSVPCNKFRVCVSFSQMMTPLILGHLQNAYIHALWEEHCCYSYCLMEKEIIIRAVKQILMRISFLIWTNDEKPFAFMTTGIWNTFEDSILQSTLIYPDVHITRSLCFCNYPLHYVW